MAPADLIGGGEIGWNFLGCLSGSGPFAAAQKGGDEANAFHRRRVVSQSGMKDPASAIAQRPEHGLVMARPRLAGSE